MNSVGICRAAATVCLTRRVTVLVLPLTLTLTFFFTVLVVNLLTHVPQRREGRILPRPEREREGAERLVGDRLERRRGDPGFADVRRTVRAQISVARRSPTRSRSEVACAASDSTMKWAQTKKTSSRWMSSLRSPFRWMSFSFFSSLAHKRNDQGDDQGENLDRQQAYRMTDTLRGDLEDGIVVPVPVVEIGRGGLLHLLKTRAPRLDGLEQFAARASSSGVVDMH
jgi:hypothetical protein